MSPLFLFFFQKELDKRLEFYYNVRDERNTDYDLQIHKA